jgi:hypothetical protein
LDGGAREAQGGWLGGKKLWWEHRRQLGPFLQPFQTSSTRQRFVKEGWLGGGWNGAHHIGK